MLNRLSQLHRDEAGNESFQSVAIMGVAVLLLIIFKSAGENVLDAVKEKAKELLGGNVKF